MQGSILLTLALTMTGNAAIRGIPIEGFWPDGAAFWAVRSVCFTSPISRFVTRQIVAHNPLDWFDHLKATSKGLRLRTMGRSDAFTDLMGEALAGEGAQWIIQSDDRDLGVRFWQDEWQLVDPDDADDRIWSVVYGELVQPLEDKRPDRQVNAVSEDLAVALSHIAHFAERCGSGFADSFKDALRVLQHGRSNFYSGIYPPGLLADDPQRLLAAAEAGWQFGGMGAWNDGGCSGTEEGRRLTLRLYELLLEAMTVAANSTYPGAN